MQLTNTPSSIEQAFRPVKSLNSQLPLPLSDSVIHHKDPGDRILRKRIVYSGRILELYGVSSTYRVLSPGLLLKKFDYIKDCLRVVLGLTPGQIEITMRLLRLWAYYGKVYPKESQVTGGSDECPLPASWAAWYSHSSQPRPGGCSKATYWRTIRLLEELGLIERVNRFIVRPHAQISNLYRLDRLVVLLAKYLSEHIAHVWDEWLRPFLHQTWPQFWSCLIRVPGDRAGPGQLVFEDLVSSRV